MLALLRLCVNPLISNTDSLPQHYFIQIPKMAPKKGDYTVVDSEWFGGKIIKNILGVSGDKIAFDSLGNVVVGGAVLGRAKKYSSAGMRLHPIRAQTIPDSYVFLGSEYPDSFDSRYQELGLIAVSRLKGWVIPIK